MHYVRMMKKDEKSWMEKIKLWTMCLKNVLPLVQNDNYSEPKLVCRQLFSNVYEDIKSVYTFFQFLSQQISK